MQQLNIRRLYRCTVLNVIRSTTFTNGSAFPKVPITGPETMHKCVQDCI